MEEKEMTLKERAEKTYAGLFISYDANESDKVDGLSIIEAALKDVWDEGFARGQEKKASCVCTASSPCGLHEPLMTATFKDAFNKGWDEAISEAKRQVQNVDWELWLIEHAHEANLISAEMFYRRRIEALKLSREGGE